MGGHLLRESNNWLISLKMKHAILMFFSMHVNEFRGIPVSE